VNPHVAACGADGGFVRAVEAAEITALAAELAAERERNRRLEAQLRNLADHDPLTDLLNRRTMDQELEQHEARCARYGPEGALLVIALDGLAAVADKQGRGAADEMLATVAERLLARLRTTDIVGRWARSELAVLLPKVNVDEIAVVADALVEIIGTAETSRVPPGSLSASIGVALVVGGPPGAVLADRAEGAVAAARRQGGGWAVAPR
jgi:diguanylate cyclase (GGDEF)-like protein